MKEPLSIWIAFNLIVLTLLLLDLFVFNRKSQIIGVKQALLQSGLWITLALLFNCAIYFYKGSEDALNFLAGYLIEESLSIDNLFVILMIFQYFKTPPKYQYKVLFLGILGAIVMRACFIFFGIGLVTRFHWILYIFGLFLAYAGIQMFLPKVESVNPDRNIVIKLIKKWIPVTSDYENGFFFIRRQNSLWATPLFISLVTVEITDLLFAFDSIPAIMAITIDPFIVYTSNIFAILGLRSLYFAISGIMPLFHYLQYGLAAILTFVGVKMLISPFIAIPISIALGFIVAALSIAIIASRLFPKRT